MNIAIMGYGVVGSGVAEVIKMNNDKIAQKASGNTLNVKYILDKRTFPGDPFESVVVNDFNIILNDDSVKVVVETMGGVEPAYTWVLACLKAGKNVVTSNKELVAVKGYELLSVAKENNVNFMFEASVGGGIPVIRPIHQCLAANEITEVAGILNGTTNYILTKMFGEGSSFDDALKTAQELGYAERNPSADVDGLDACRKICILAALCFGTHVYPDSVHTEGIRNITAEDVEYSRELGYTIKLIGSAIKNNENIQIMVSPSLVSYNSPLSSVNDVFNAVLARGNAVGDVIFYGRGAGKLPTASAVVADIIDCVNHSEKRKDIGWNDYTDGFVSSYDDFVSKFYIRAKGCDCLYKSLSDGSEKINGKDGEYAFITKEISFAEVKKATEKSDILSLLRVTNY